jgi:hypothetical protein
MEGRLAQNVNISNWISVIGVHHSIFCHRALHIAELFCATIAGSLKQINQPIFFNTSAFLLQNLLATLVIPKLLVHAMPGGITYSV